MNCRGIFINNLSPTRDDKGYIELNKEMPFQKRELFKQDKVISQRVKILNDLLQKLSNKGIQVALVISPSYYAFSGNDPSIKIIENLTQKYKNTQLVNYENNPLFDDHKLYWNVNHLNKEGASKFSNDIFDKLVKAQ